MTFLMNMKHRQAGSNLQIGGRSSQKKHHGSNDPDKHSINVFRQTPGKFQKEWMAWLQLPLHQNHQKGSLPAEYQDGNGRALVSKKK